jgi:hypothetical protein
MVLFLESSVCFVLEDPAGALRAGTAFENGSYFKTPTDSRIQKLCLIAILSLLSISNKAERTSKTFHSKSRARTEVNLDFLPILTMIVNQMYALSSPVLYSYTSRT